MRVTLISHTPEPEKLVAASAKLCYSAVGVADIARDLSQEEAGRFVDLLMGLGHESPLEHVSFTFGIEGVSRVLTHQLVRHRIASYSQQSQRYVSLEGFSYITPPSISALPEARALFEEAMEADQVAYEKITTLLEKEQKEKFLSQGWPEKEAKKRAKKAAIEDARFVFPGACETKIVVTMNARSLVNFFKHRTCRRAQWEIQALATEMLRQVKEVAPKLFHEVGPPCLVGPCPEGKMTCGQIDDVRRFFERMDTDGR